MVIRSQNKKAIYNFNNLTGVRVYENKIEVIANNNAVKIAEYSSEEKAIEVLDDLHQSFRNMAFVDVAVFQMPED